MARRFAAAIVIALFLALSGCTLGGLPRQCEDAAQDKLSSCIYAQAVLEQNSFYCYRIGVLDHRKACIRDSSDPLAKKRLEAMSEEEREGALLGKKPPKQQPTQQQPANNGPEPQQVNVTVIPPAGPQDISVAELDQEFYGAAVQANDMQLCEQIYDPEVLKSCISQVARQKKNIAICETLSQQDYVEICRMYSQGEIKQ